MKVLIAVLLATTTTACVLVAEQPAGPKAGHEAVVCHKGKKTMTLPREAAAAHLNHGDHYGPC